MITDLRTLAKALGGEISGNQLRCPGPGHSAADRSLVIKLDANAPNGILFKSFAGDDAIVCLDYIRAKGGLPAFKPNGNGKHHRASDDAIADALMAAVQNQRPKRPQGRVIAVFGYTAADGTLLYQVLKYDPKNFRQRQPDGRGGWVWNLDGVRRVIYRWPQLIEHKYATVHFTEGEKDAETLAALGLCATTIASGKWTDEMVEALRDRNVWVFEDKDKNEAGSKRALEAAERLYGVASQIRIIRLPGLTGESGSKDVTNWLMDMGHTKDNLFEVCDATPDWEPDSEQKPEPTPEAKPAKAAAEPIVRLFFFDDLEKASPKPWLIKNVIARGETSSWIAAPGRGKSAMLTDIVVSGSHGIDWRGYRTKGKFAAVYFALERADLVKRRLIAHRLRDELPALPIAICAQVLDLINKTCVDFMLAAIKRTEDHFGQQVGLGVIDTYAKAIAAGGGDEASSKDQNVALANIRRVIDRLPHMHIASIGHTGKDESRGERGSNAKLADVDVQVYLKGDDVKVADVIKANDQQLGTLTNFRLEPFDFGPDEDGDPSQVWILSKEQILGTVIVGRKLSDKQQNALDALHEAILTHGIDPPTAYELPRGVKIVLMEQWREILIRSQILTGANIPARFDEVRNALLARRIIGVRDDHIWSAARHTIRSPL